MTLPCHCVSFFAAGASFFSAASWAAPAGMAANADPASTKASKVTGTFIASSMLVANASDPTHDRLGFVAEDSPALRNSKENFVQHFTCQYAKELPRSPAAADPGRIWWPRQTAPDGEAVSRGTQHFNLQQGTNSPSEPLRDRSGVQYAVFVKGTQADHAIIVLNLAGIDIVHCLTVVLLTGPLGRTVVLDSPLDIRVPIPNHQGRLVLIASRDNTLHTVLLRVLPFRRFRALLCEHRC